MLHGKFPSPLKTAEFDDLLFTTDVPDVSPEFQEFADIVFEGQDNFSDRLADITMSLKMYFLLIETIAFYVSVDLLCCILRMKFC